jgi:uncharacterized membrane protein
MNVNMTENIIMIMMEEFILIYYYYLSLISFITIVITNKKSRLENDAEFTVDLGRMKEKYPISINICMIFHCFCLFFFIQQNLTGSDWYLKSYTSHTMNTWI